MQQMLKVMATGSADNNQENIQLVNQMGSFSHQLGLAGDDRILADEQGDGTNVTHLSTAKYVLLKDMNDDSEITNDSDLMSLSQSLSADKLLNTAAFIKLLVDNPDYSLGGASLLTLIDPDSGSTEDAMAGYLAENGLVDDNGNPSEQYLEALEEAK